MKNKLGFSTGKGFLDKVDNATKADETDLTHSEWVCVDYNSTDESLGTATLENGVYQIKVPPRKTTVNYWIESIVYIEPIDDVLNREKEFILGSLIDKEDTVAKIYEYHLVYEDGYRVAPTVTTIDVANGTVTTKYGSEVKTAWYYRRIK